MIAFFWIVTRRRGDGVSAMRVVVFSPIRLFGEGVALCIQNESFIDAILCCFSADRIVQDAIQFRADVVLIDMTAPNGLQQGRAIAAACPEMTIIALGLPDASADVIACVDAGFVSYVPRDAPISKLQEIIAMAMRGEVPCNPKVSGGLLRELRTRRSQIADERENEPLTRREREVLRLLGRGLPNKEIARQFSLSEATIKNHVHEILTKLRVRRRAEAMARLRDEPWIASVGP